MTNQAKGKLYDVVVIRFFAIIMVVAFHAYGMMYADHFHALKHIYSQLYFTWNQCIFINVAMPMFVFVSGYLFAFLWRKGKYQNFWELVKNKVKRLLLPYFVFGLVMMATTSNFHPFNLLYGNYWHLWFLPMLFWCFVVAFFLSKYFVSLQSQVIIACVSFALSLFFPFFPEILGFQYITRWFCWFYLGIIIYNYKDKLIVSIAKFRLEYILFIAYLAITIYKPTKYGDIYWYNVIAQICIVVVLWYWVNKIDWHKLKLMQPIVSISNCSYGIYIFHNWIQMYLISRTAQRLFPLERWAAEHTILFPLCFFLLSLGISYVLTRLLLKTRAGRFLIG